MVEKKKISLSESHTKKKTFRLKFPRYPREHFVLDVRFEALDFLPPTKWVSYNLMFYIISNLIAGVFWCLVVVCRISAYL